MLTISVTAATCIAVGKLKIDSQNLTKAVAAINPRVITTLAHIDMVIWVYWLLRTKFTSENLDGTVRDNLCSAITMNAEDV